jgi:hypothetical protein
LNVLDQVKLLRAIGAEQSRNQPYVQIVNMAASVAQIDDVPCVMPSSERQIDAAVDRLGDDGFAAVMVNMQRRVDALMAAAEGAADGEVKTPDPLEKSA